MSLERKRAERDGEARKERERRGEGADTFFRNLSRAKMTDSNIDS